MRSTSQKCDTETANHYKNTKDLFDLLYKIVIMISKQSPALVSSQIPTW